MLITIFGSILVAATTYVVVVSCVSFGSSNLDGYCNCINSDVNIGRTFLTVNIVSYVSGNASNITAYVII